MMWDILPDISVRETGGSTLCTSAATVGDYTLLSIFSWPTPHSVIMQCGITGERGYRQKGEETQDVRAVPVPSSKSSSSVRTLLGDPGRVITELYVNKKHNTKVRFLFVWLQKPHRLFLQTLLQQISEKTAFEWPFKMDEQQFGLFTLAQQLTDLYPSRVQRTNAAWNRTPDVALLSPVALIFVVSSPPPFLMGVFALVDSKPRAIKRERAPCCNWTIVPGPWDCSQVSPELQWSRGLRHCWMMQSQCYSAVDQDLMFYFSCPVKICLDINRMCDSYLAAFAATERILEPF